MLIRMKCPHCRGRFDMTYTLEAIQPASQPTIRYGLLPDEKIIRHLEVYGSACATDLQRALCMNGTLIADTTNTLVQGGVIKRWRQFGITGRPRILFSLTSTTAEDLPVGLQSGGRPR